MAEHAVTVRILVRTSAKIQAYALVKLPDGRLDHEPIYQAAAPTNRRIISVRGVREPQISSWLLLDVRNTYVHSPLAEKLTGLGTITFVTDNTDDVPHQWRSVAKPEEVHAKIRRAIENVIDQGGL